VSGPKGYGYSVVSAEELRRRENAVRTAQGLALTLASEEEP
jgi:hypothetical protein